MTDLAATLNAQVAAVDRRVGRLGPYSHESDEVRRAAECVPELRRQLNLGDYVRSLTPPTGKPQFLLVFEDECGMPVLLKVYGRGSSAEGAVQRLWTEVGVRCAETIDEGDGSCTWLLMKLIDGEALSASREREWNLFDVTSQLAKIMKTAHAAGTEPLPNSLSLPDGIRPHLRAVTGALASHRYQLPADWEEWSAEIYADGAPTLVHGDLFPGNLIRDRKDGGLWIIDSCAYWGNAAFDMARWTVRTASPDEYHSMARTWQEVEPLDDRLAAGMLAVESLMQAGVREIRKEEHSRGWERRDAATQVLLDAIPTLLDQWRDG